MRRRRIRRIGIRLVERFQQVPASPPFHQAHRLDRKRFGLVDEPAAGPPLKVNGPPELGWSPETRSLREWSS